LIPRYTRPEMSRLWTDQFRWETILEIELLAAEALARRKQADPRAVRTLRRKARVDVGRILEIEKTVKHDVIAFLTQIEEKAGSAAKVLHQGLTSSDILDTALAVQIQKATALLERGLKKLLPVVKGLALRYKDAVMMGRSHGVHAEPITFGFKAAGWYAELKRNLRRLQEARRETDYERRIKVYREVEKLALQDAPWISQHHRVFQYLYQPYVQGVEINALGAHYIPMKKFWLKKTAERKVEGTKP